MIGIDILENERIEKKIKDTPQFINSFLCEEEIKYVNQYSDNIGRITGIFCVKEAVKKAFGCPVELTNKSMEIRHFDNGKPYVVFDKALKKLAGNCFVEISVSHSKKTTVAVAIVFRDEHGEECDCHKEEHNECNCEHCNCDISDNCGCIEGNCTCEDDCDCEDDCHCEDDCDCHCDCEDDCHCEDDCDCHCDCEEGCHCEDACDCHCDCEDDCDCHCDCEEGCHCEDACECKNEKGSCKDHK